MGRCPPRRPLRYVRFAGHSGVQRSSDPTEEGRQAAISNPKLGLAFETRREPSHICELAQEVPLETSADDTARANCEWFCDMGDAILTVLAHRDDHIHLASVWDSILDFLCISLQLPRGSRVVSGNSITAFPGSCNWRAVRWFGHGYLQQIMVATTVPPKSHEGQP